MLWFVVGIIVGVALTAIYYIKTIDQTTHQLMMLRNFNMTSQIKITTPDTHITALIEELNSIVNAYRDTVEMNERMLQQTRQMTTSIAHDFRTPLTSMLGYVQLLQGTHQSDEDLRRLKIIEKRIAILNNHIEDFYTLSQLTSNEYPLFLEVHNPARILIETLVVYHEDLNRKFDIVDINVQEGNYRSIFDTHAFERIIGNLLKNALNHGETRFSLKTSVHEKYYRIVLSNRVASTDIDVTRIFDRTYKESQDRSNHSSGLGLNIARDLAEAMEMHLKVRLHQEEIFFIVDIPLSS